jgi:hypothetical protein
MTGANLAQISGTMNSAEALGTLDIERARELRLLINAWNTHTILQREDERNALANHVPPPGGTGHPGIDVRMPSQPPALPTTTAPKPERRTFTLAEVVRYAAATGGFTATGCSLLLVPLGSAIGEDNAMAVCAFISAIFIAVLLIATVVIVRDEDKPATRVR